MGRAAVSRFEIKIDNRIMYAIIQIILAIVLLFNPSVETVQTPPSNQIHVISGMPEFNASIIGERPPDDLATMALVSLVTLLRDPTIAFPYPMSTQFDCTIADDECFSYIMPGRLDEIILTDTSKKLVDSPHRDAAWFIAEAAPAYNLEYFPLQDDVVFEDSDCRIYPTAFQTIKVCLNNIINQTLAAGMRLLEIPG